MEEHVFATLKQNSGCAVSTGQAGTALLPKQQLSRNVLAYFQCFALN